MISLREESIYLQDDFDMYIVPSVKYKHKVEDKIMWFPESSPLRRKLLGQAMSKTLLYDRESLVNFLRGDYDGFVITDVQRDKKDRVTSLTIKIE